MGQQPGDRPEVTVAGQRFGDRGEGRRSEGCGLGTETEGQRSSLGTAVGKQWSGGQRPRASGCGRQSQNNIWDRGEDYGLGTEVEGRQPGTMVAGQRSGTEVKANGPGATLGDSGQEGNGCGTAIAGATAGKQRFGGRDRKVTAWGLGQRLGTEVAGQQPGDRPEVTVAGQRFGDRGQGLERQRSGSSRRGTGLRRQSGDRGHGTAV